MNVPSSPFVLSCDSQRAAGLRLLVVIASFGTKNLPHLQRLITSYRLLPLQVDLVVLSEAPKRDLGPGVEVIVGLPTRNPWSLPFGHKRIFDERAEEYDLFIYSEDDVAITETNIEAFLRVTPLLGEDEVAGFLRYEVGPDGQYSYPEVHGSFNWKLDTVRRRQSVTVAEFSNVHAACFLLTREQLRRVIASRAFLRPPYEGEYDMLCTAATDPYTQCGLRKVICISELEHFVVHHLPNRYAGQLGLSHARLKQQVAVLLEVAAGRGSSEVIGLTSPRGLRRRWAKRHDEPVDFALLESLPQSARTVLSLGSGGGELERHLAKRGLAVTVVPLDAMLGVIARQEGMMVIPGALGQALRRLAGARFDCVVATNLLHLTADPAALTRDFARLTGPGGALLLSGPNFGDWRNRVRWHWRPEQFDEVKRVEPATLARSIWAAGMTLDRIGWWDRRGRAARCGAWSAGRWTLCARRLAEF